MFARIEQQLNGGWNVIVDGRTVIRDESYTVASTIEWAVNHPTRWEPTEAYEIADQIRRGER